MVLVCVKLKREVRKVLTTLDGANKMQGVTKQVKASWSNLLYTFCQNPQPSVELLSNEAEDGLMSCEFYMFIH